MRRMVAFQVGPRINAIGRMGLDPMLVVELFTTSDEERAAEIATMLDTANKEPSVVYLRDITRRGLPYAVGENTTTIQGAEAARRTTFTQPHG